ncbi:MAG: GldG family protein [Anaerolineae bacterium]|nr:GldG family protein [Anaerolineae bacterium]
MSNRYDTVQPNRLALNRLRVARILSGIGALALVIAVIAFLLQRDITPLVLLSLVMGMVGIGLWTILAPNDLRSVISGRQALYGTNSIFTSILFAGIIAVVYTLSTNLGLVADLTAVHYYSLKADSVAAVKQLDRPLVITAFYSSSRLSDQALDMPILNMYKDAAPDKIKLAIVDPDQQPLKARSFGLTGSFGIYVSAQDQRGEPDLNNTVLVDSPYARETQITQAILKLQARGKYRVLFTIGHNEIGTDVEKKEDAYAIRAGMEKVGILTGTIDLRTQDIPQDTAAVVMLRPEIDLQQAEVNRIAQYMANGGRLLVMAQPAYRGQIQFMVPAESPMAKYLWETWGIRPQNDIVYDPKSNVDDPYRVLAARVSQHPIMNRDTAGTSQVRPLLTLAQSWEIAKDGRPNVQIAQLILTSDEAVGKVNVRKIAANPDDPNNLKAEAGDVTGPLTMAAAAENTRNNARLVVIGAGDWILNEVVITFDGEILWTNMIDWLTHYLSDISVKPVITQLPLIVDASLLNVVSVITMVVLPGVVLLAGAVVWWDRQRRQ